MACDCIRELKEDIIKSGKYGDDIALDNVALIFNPAKGTMTNRWPSLVVKYYEKKKDGTPRKNPSRVNIIPTYCPSCGTKYEEE